MPAFRISLSPPSSPSSCSSSSSSSAVPIAVAATLDDARIKGTMARVSRFLGLGFLVLSLRCSSRFRGVENAPGVKLLGVLLMLRAFVSVKSLALVIAFTSIFTYEQYEKELSAFMRIAYVLGGKVKLAVIRNLPAPLSPLLNVFY
ncbi:hypothetical protein Droror1_Dr00012374 [Drosera rotundifolia]